MDIPRSFRLAGRTWKVRRISNAAMMKLYVKAREAIGEEVGDDVYLAGFSSDRKTTIYVDTDSPQTYQEVTFLHELVHAIKYTQGEAEHNEREIDGMAHLLHQYEMTKR